MMTRKNQVDDLLTRFERKPINQKKCPYCHNGTGKKHYTLLQCHYFANDNYVEATVDINTDKSLLLIVGDYYGDDTDEIKINYCPICGRKLTHD